MLGACWAWMLVGALGFGWAAHVEDGKTGNSLMAAGLAVGYGGSYFTLIAYYLRAVDQGDW